MAGRMESPKRKGRAASPQTAFGDLVREMRLSKGLSQRDFATLTDLERSTIAYIELGKRQPTLASIIELAHALDVLPSDLLREVEKRAGIKV